MQPKLIAIIGLLLLIVSSSFTVRAELLDRIVAVVEDDVILDGELTRETYKIIRNLQANKVMMPPVPVLRKQVLEHLIVDKLQKQFAQKSGIKVSDDMLINAISGIAKGNNLTVDEFKQELKKQNINFQDFEDDIRSEIIINQLRAREISARIRVTDREISHHLETESSGSKDPKEYHLGHILISLPESASVSLVQQAQEKAKKVIADLKAGANFEQTAIAVSDGESALKGGRLGWMSINEIPTIFAGLITEMNEGDVAELVRSPSGFHITKLLELKNKDKYMVTKTNARHILVKTNELIDDEAAKKKILDLTTRIVNGDDFATLARAHSDDKGTAINGGDLGWIGPGDLVPIFESTMNQLRINEMSEPVQTQFGWHLIQVLERQEKDNSTEFKKSEVKKMIRKRKIEEETELWMRRLRDEAFVKIQPDRV